MIRSGTERMQASRRANYSGINVRVTRCHEDFVASAGMAKALSCPCHYSCWISFSTLLIFAASGYADFFSERRDLTNVYIHENDVIRVFYDTFGEHTVELTDVNGDTIPDVVENVAKQSSAAYRLFIESFGFQNPLQSERYHEATYIDVNLLSQGTLNGNNGIAYDGLVTFNRPIDPVGTRAITFDVATSVDPTVNVTPVHEMFHLIQNGYTFFKTRWYTEGMARWSEHALDTGGRGTIQYDPAGPWPQNEVILQDLFSRTYSAEFIFWNPLAFLDDRDGTISEDSISSSIANLTYTGSGGKVLEDLELVGIDFMREVLEELAAMDDIAFAALGYDSWSEDNQKSIGNSPFIYQAVLDVARRRGHDVGPYSALAIPEPCRADLALVALAVLLAFARTTRRHPTIFADAATNIPRDLLCGNDRYAVHNCDHRKAETIAIRCPLGLQVARWRL